MRVTYDSNKNKRNIDERGLSFDLVAYLEWESALYFVDDRHDYSEIRYAVYALLEQRLHSVVFTETEGGIRVISFRKANHREVKTYEQRSHY